MKPGRGGKVAVLSQVVGGDQVVGVLTASAGNVVRPSAKCLAMAGPMPALFCGSLAASYRFGQCVMVSDCTSPPSLFVMKKNQFGTSVIFPVIGSTWRVSTPRLQWKHDDGDEVSSHTNCEAGSKTDQVSKGERGSAKSEVRAPVDASMEYIPQLAANRNLPLAGEVRLFVLLQLEPKGEPEISVRAPVFESILYP
jgi:hypothetical protein